MAILNSSIITGSLNVTGNIYAVNSVYENGVALVDKYLGKTAKAADSSKLDGHSVSYFITTASDTQTKDGSLVVRGDTTFGPSVPNSRTGVTQAPTYLCRASFDRNASAIAAFFPYTGIGDWFFAADKKPNFIIRSTFQGFGTDADVYNANFYTWGQTGGERLQNLFNWRYGDGWQCLPSKISSSTPAIIEIKSTSLLTYTDVLRLFITGHNGDRGGQAYSGSLTDYQIDVCTSYANDTWKTVIQRSGVNDAIGNTPVYALQIPKTGSEQVDYTEFYGLRLTIRGATAGSGYPYIKITTIQVRDYRPAFTVSDAIGAISMNGGEMYGNLWLKGNSSNQCIGPNVTNNCRLGDDSHRWKELHAKEVYENGTTLTRKYFSPSTTAGTYIATRNSDGTISSTSASTMLKGTYNSTTGVLTITSI